MHSIYILLTKSGTLLSRAIAVATGAAYTHVSICLEDNLTHFYSFARRGVHLPLPAGLVCEELKKGYWGCHPGIPGTLLMMKVEDNVYARIKHRLDQMNLHAADYRYSLLGILFCGADIAHRRPDHYFCSQFIGELLCESGAVVLPRDASLLHPDDFPALPTAELCFSGTLGELADAIESGTVSLPTATANIRPFSVGRL